MSLHYYSMDVFNHLYWFLAVTFKQCVLPVITFINMAWQFMEVQYHLRKIANITACLHSFVSARVRMVSLRN